MSYIQKILQPGEIVLNQTRLHWFIYLPAIMTIILALLILAVGTVIAPDFNLDVQLTAALLGLIGLWVFFVAWIRRSSTELAVTNRRIIHKTGILSRRSQEMNREKVESVDVLQSLTGRIFGYGTILVRGVGSSWEPFSHIADPLSFRNSITAAPMENSREALAR
jgi:uncharacterized membrane protein YdbT with pleckstrin-like domain